MVYIHCALKYWLLYLPVIISLKLLSSTINTNDPFLDTIGDVHQTSICYFSKQTGGDSETERAISICMRKAKSTDCKPLTVSGVLNDENLDRMVEDGEAFKVSLFYLLWGERYKHLCDFSHIQKGGTYVITPLNV